MKRLFYIVASAGIVIIALSIAFYFFHYLPTKEANIHKDKLIENQIKCKQAVSAYIEKDDNLPAGSEVYPPHYKFVDDLSTCLYLKELAVFGTDGTVFFERSDVIDVYTNTTLATWNRHYNLAGEINNESGKENFSSLVAKYFPGQGLE
jgi:hypothetical protein